MQLTEAALDAKLILRYFGPTVRSMKPAANAAVNSSEIARSALTTMQALFGGAQKSCREIVFEDALAAHKSSKAVFVDVREPEEVVAGGKVAGAVHVPRALLESYAPAAFTDHAKPYILICEDGRRAKSAGAMMVAMGFNNVSAASFAEWKRQRGPIEPALAAAASRKTTAVPAAVAAVRIPSFHSKVVQSALA